MKISELAKAAQTQAETIRFYEREGLLPQAARTESNYRSYDQSSIERLAFIRHCRSLDMALDEIRTLLRFKDAPSAQCGDVNTLLDEHIDHVTKRIRELKAMEKTLKAMRLQCRDAQLAKDCGILNGLVEAAHQPTASPQPRGHIQGTHR
jgi:Cd(II)/Pb(II)-responsive transcriptional regulator